MVIPESNIRNLVIRRDVIDAIAEGQFHIYPVKSIDEGLAILTGMPLRRLRRPNHRSGCSRRLKELAVGLKEFAAAGHDGAEASKP